VSRKQRPGRHAAPGALAPWPADGSAPALWTLPVGIALIGAVWMGWTALLLGLLGRGTPGAAGTPAEVALVLATVAGLWPAVWAAERLLPGRGLGRLLTAGSGWRDAAAGFGLGAGAAALSVLFGVAFAGWPEPTGLGLSVWLGWLVPLVLLIALQASGEELVFRGWMLDRLARRWRHPAIWAGGPAAAFALLHAAPGLPEPAGWLYVATTGLFGLSAAALVRRSHGLPAAMGLHAGINLPALMGAGIEGIVSGAQLWSWPRAEAGTLLLGDLAVSAALLGLVLSPLCPIHRRPDRGAGIPSP